MVVRDALRVTSIERTLLDLASLGVRVDRLAHEALAKRLTTKRKLVEVAERHRGRKGAPALLAAATGREVRSDLEAAFLAFLSDHGLPLPLTNVYLGRYTVDCLYAEQRLIVELDEHGHRSAYAFEEDRERDRHHATLGYTTIRVTEASLNASTAASIRSALDVLKHSLVD